MRRTLIVLWLAAAVPAFAPAREPRTDPRAAADARRGAADEPEVTIVKRGEDTVTEYRLRGKLYMVKVTPPTAPTT